MSTNNWRVRGKLLQPAELLSTADHQALVCVLIEQAGGLPALACQNYGKTGAAHFAASAAARRLAKGTQVEVNFEGVKLDRHRGEQVLRLLLVDRIVSLNVPAHHSEHETAEA